VSQLEAVAKELKDWSKIVIAYEPIWFVIAIPTTDTVY